MLSKFRFLTFCNPFFRFVLIFQSNFRNKDNEVKACFCRFLKGIEESKYTGLSSQKLLDAGFKFKYGFEEMFDGAIQCCKEKGFI